MSECNHAITYGPMWDCARACNVYKCEKCKKWFRKVERYEEIDMAEYFIEGCVY